MPRPKGSRNKQYSGLSKLLESLNCTPPDEFLIRVYLDENQPVAERVRAAGILMPYIRKKMPVAHDVSVTVNPVAELLEAVTSETMRLPVKTDPKLINGSVTRRDQ